MKAIFIAKCIKKIYKNGKVALDNISFELPEKGLVSFVGSSGSGKTTLLNIIGGIDRPTKGDVFYKNRNLSTASQKFLDDFRCSEVSFAFQDFNLIKELNVFDNIALGMSLQGYSKKQIFEKVNIVANKVGLDSVLYSKITEISGGQLERVSIARALVKDSKVLLCDEPTANLDPENSESLFTLLKEISHDILVVVVSHNLGLVKQFSDYVFSLKEGKIVEGSQNLNLEKMDDSELNVTSAKFRFSYLVKLVFGNFKHTKVSGLISLLLMSILFATFSGLLSLKYYNPANSYAQTYKNNKQYIVPVSMYSESDLKEWNGSEYVYVGPQDYAMESSEKDFDGLIKKLDGRLDAYCSYFYNVSLNSFDKKHNILVDSDFYSNSFKTIVPISSFDNFNHEFVCGGLPKNDNEVLIYDYMADSLKHYGILEGNLIGQDLINYTNEHSFKISGILKSNYDKYSYLEGKNLNNDDKMALTYLNELETIYCTNDLFDQLKDNNKRCAIKMEFVNLDDESFIYENPEVEIKYFDSVDEKDFDFSEIYSEFSHGFVISKKLAMRIANYNNESEFDGLSYQFPFNETVCFGSKAFCYKYKIYFNYPHFGKTLDPGYVGGGYSKIIGISNDLENEYCYAVNHDPNSVFDDFLCFRGFLINLSNDWVKNEKILGEFIWPIDKPDSYYENLNEVVYGYTLYSGLAVTVLDATNYAPMIVKTARTVTIFVSISSVLVVFYFAFCAIRNNYYKIGILKSLGLSNLRIAALFCVESLFIFCVAIIVSIPLSFLLMGFINNDFIEGISPVLKIFNLMPSAVMLSFGIGLGIFIIGTIYPLIRLYIQTPIEMIRKN